MYGWQVFMGGWVVALMIQSIFVRLWRNALGAEELILERHFHDIGKLCFAFTAFWGYITFGQYLVIWYGNMPEETHFFFLRMSQPWVRMTVACGVLMFVLPFFGLMGKYPKIFTPTMTFFALSSIVGLWIQRYVEIYPSIYATRRPSSGRRRASSGRDRDVAAVRSLRDRRDVRLPRPVGRLLPGVHERVPAHAGVHADVAVPRRGPGAGGSEDNGAAAGARIAGTGTGNWERKTLGMLLSHERHPEGFAARWLGLVHRSSTNCCNALSGTAPDCRSLPCPP